MLVSWLVGWTCISLLSWRRVRPRPEDRRSLFVWEQGVVRWGLVMLVAISVMLATHETGVTLQTAFVTPSFYACVALGLFSGFPVALWGGWVFGRTLAALCRIDPPADPPR